MHIIIPSDSSRRGFQQNIQSYRPFLLHSKISLLVIPGAIIEKMTRETKNILKLVKDNSQCTNTMFFVEICNLTGKFSSNTHQFVTKICNHSSQKVHTTIQADNQSFHKLRTFNCKVHFATISTVSLTSYINFRQKKGNLRKGIRQCEHITYQQKSN